MSPVELSTLRLAVSQLEHGRPEWALSTLRVLLPDSSDGRNLWLMSLPDAAAPSPEYPNGRSFKLEVIKAIRYNTHVSIGDAKAIAESLPYNLGPYSRHSDLARDLLRIGAAVEWR